MEQLIAHLLGDYILQSDWMATEKRKHMWVAYTHGFVYSLSFVFIVPGFWAWTVIFVTHSVIDYFGIARYVLFAKNYIGPVSVWYKWSDCSATGYHKDRPPWLATWLMIIGDNTMHLLINYLAIRYL